jgi:hypothetical protein
MPTKTSLLELAERFRSHARATDLPHYREVMLRVALELETMGALRDGLPEPASLPRPTAVC